MKTYCLFTLSFLLLHYSYAQDSTDISAQDEIEDILDDESVEQEVQFLGEDLEFLKQHPINLVSPNYNELLKLPFISPFMAEAIVLFTDTVAINSTEQLLLIPLITQSIYEKLLPFVTIQHESAVHSLSSILLPNKFETRTRYEQRLQHSDGYVRDLFLGEPYSTYQRLRIGNENIEAAGLFEKDAGELYGDGFTAGYVSAKNVIGMHRIVIGNYNISSGQGLVLAKNISTTKGSNAVGQIRHRGSTISPTISTDEFRYFQGIAAQYIFDKFSFTGFYSNRLLPASIDSLGTVTSFYTSGIYRTTNDLKRQQTLSEKAYGGMIEYHFEKLQTISFTLVNTEYNRLLTPSVLDLHNNKRISSGSISWDLSYSFVNLFGETATNDGIAFSKLFGIIFPLVKELSIGYQYRLYSKNFVSPFSRPFGERDVISDGESGNYIGAQYHLGALSLNAYADIYSLPATTFGFDAHGTEYFSQIQYAGIKNLRIQFHIRQKTKYQVDIKQFDDLREQINYRLAYTLKINRDVSLTQRFEIVNVAYDPSKYKEKGFLTYVEGTYKKRDVGLIAKCRMTFFDTDSYDSRVYQYESDVAGNYSNPPIYGKGIRWYLVVGYEVFSRFQLSLKYSETKKQNIVSFGSGYDEIAGNFDNNIAVQLDLEL